MIVAVHREFDDGGAPDHVWIQPAIVVGGDRSAPRTLQSMPAKLSNSEEKITAILIGSRQL